MDQLVSILASVVIAFTYMWLLDVTKRQHRELMARRERWKTWAGSDAPDDEWSEAVIIEEDEA